MEKIRVGVIGVGHVGSLHAKIYSTLPDVKLTFLCDLIPNRTKVIKGKDIIYSKDFKEAFNKVDAVSIAVPTSLHYTIAKEFLKRGIDVLIEKPITSNLKDAEALIKLAKVNSLILQVGHVERVNKALQAIKDIPGEIKFIECHRIGPFKRRGIDVSVVLDLMIHDIDIILALVNSNIKKIEAVGVNVVTDLPDIANAKLIFENGTVCNITSSRVSDDLIRKIRIFKEKCYISLDYKNQEVKIYRKVKNKIYKKDIPIKKEQPLELELRTFINCVKKRKQPPISGEEAKRALEIALKIEKKIKSTPLK
jgi:predicted dehydrogenase